MPPPAPPFPALIAPTASGKSALALPIAAALNAEIISVDSGAVYRGMDIGTATPNAAMQAQVPHHLINIVEPTDTYNVARFYHDARAAAAAIRQRGKLPLLVGGSMMYINALINGLTAAPVVSCETQMQVQQLAEQEGSAAIHARLKAVDAAAAARLQPTDRQRLIRAYCLALSRGTAAATLPNHPPVALNLLLLIPVKRKLLRQRIEQRLQAMWQAGLLDETRQLLRRWPQLAKAPPLKMAGYRQAAEYIRGEINEQTMRRQAYFATSQLAKRQLTWLQKWRGQATVLDPFAIDDPAAAAIDALNSAH